MYIYLLIGLVSVLISFFAHDKNKGLKWSFLFITTFLAIRYEWGSDYTSYFEQYIEFSRATFGLFDLERNGDLYRHQEWGWVLINRLFYYSRLGFFGMVIALTLFENYIVYRIIQKYVSKNHYWMAIMLWYFNVMSFCINASMMRQYLCICLYLIVVDLMIEKKRKGYLLWSIFIIMVSIVIHRSSIVLLASLPIFYIRINKPKLNITLVILVGVVFVLWDTFGVNLIEPFMTQTIEESENLSEYMIYLGEEKTGLLSSGLGVIFQYLVFVVFLILLPRFDRKKQQPIVFLLLLSYFFAPLAAIAPLASRLALYFSFLAPLCWVWLFEKSAKQPFLYLVFFAQIAILIRQIPQFFFSQLWMRSFFEYHTIFSAGGWM